MKNSLMLLAFFIAPVLVFCQNNTPSVKSFGGGEFKAEHTECLSPTARAIIEQQNEENIARLERTGAFTQLRLSPQVVTFDWPLRQKVGFDTDPSYYGISNYVDQNTAPTSIQDYNCNARTYDGHKGTDIFSWPFQWKRMDDNSLEIIAADAGVIINKIDGFEDQHCACVNYDWNAVYIRHADNSVSWYGHMKKGTPTTKTIGQSVAKGEYLGVVGSSGCSTGPHLHFEVYNSTGKLVDPYTGTCNALNTTSWWATQKPWRDPTLNRLQLGTAPSVYGDCTTYKDITNESYQYAYGSKIYITAFFHDQTLSDVTTYTMYRPDNSIANTWTHSSPSTYNASWWYWSFTLPSNTPGTWKVVAEYKNQTVQKTFTLAPTVAVSKIGEVEAVFYPIPFSDNLNLNYLSEEKTTVEISDIQGKILKVIALESKVATHTLLVSELPKGIYIAKIKSNSHSIVKKIIKS
jgi:hypothetical protein